MEVLLDTCGRRDVKSLLLLLFLFVWKAAADCSKPAGGENIVLSDAALLLNSFPEGIDVTLECANGYIIDSGSGSISCNGGHWSEPDLTCKKKDCGVPEAQPNMRFNISEGTLFGAEIKVNCDKGYEISGSSYRTCLVRGWSGKSTCEIVTCDKPGEVTNGKSSWISQDDPTYGEIIQYVCNDGYTLIGKDKITCSETGEYDSQPPECKEASTTTESSARETTRRDKTITTSAVSPLATVSPSTRENVFIGVTTEGGITTNMVTPTPTPPTQEASTTRESSATETAHRDKTITTSAVSPLTTVSPSARGIRGILTTEDKSATTSVTSTMSSSFQEINMHASNKNTGYALSLVTGVVVSTAFVIYMFSQRRKG